MRKMPVLCAILMLLCSCSVAEQPEDILEQSAALLAEGWQTEVRITAAEVEAKGCLEWTADQQSLTYESPESISGLCFTQSASGVTVSMEGLSGLFDAGEILDSTVAKLVFSALGQIGPEEEATVADGKILLEGKASHGDFVLTIDSESALPLKLELEDVEVLFEAGE